MTTIASSGTTGSVADGLVDAGARHRIAHVHDETLFVDAGAGSGKTSALVARLVHLVLSGTPVRRMAAITFSEAAAAELRARVRQTLEDVADPTVGVPRFTDDCDETERARRAAAAAEALDELDGATICTLHAFAQRLLLAAPVEAGLPPRVDVHDELSSALRFEDRWRRFEVSLLEDDALAPLMRASLALGVTSSQLQDVARTLGANWDLVEEAESAGTLLRQRQTVVDLAGPVDDWIARWRALVARRDACTDPACKLLAWLDEHAARLAHQLATNRDDPYVVLAIAQLAGGVPKLGNKGRKGDWPDGVKTEIVDAASGLLAEMQRHRADVVDAVLTRLGAEIGRYTLDDADSRRLEGQLEFHDLLVLARRLLRNEEHVRQRFHDRYSHLLIDEFQDTDPIQVEIATRLAADPALGLEVSWPDLPVEQGRLFFVGDPKQSIYRFRRADIDLFERTAARHASGQTALVANFRTVAPILDFCNLVFADMIGDDVSHDDAGRIAQPGYRPLHAVRGRIADDPGPAVLVLEGGHGTIGEAKHAEAVDVAAALARAKAEAWSVQPRDERPRPCRWSDMTVLIPSRSTLSQLREALEDHGVPYRIESGTLVYGTTEVNDLLAALGAIDDPGDAIAVTGALRSPLYGCGDDDLRRWVAAGRRLTYLGPDVRPDDELAAAAAAGHPVDPVEVALADLRARHRAAPFLRVPEIVASLIRDRHLLVLAVLGDDHRDVWRLYRVVTEHARQFADLESGGLRQFLHWVGLQRDDRIRANSPVIPEADVDAVRIMTIHGSKGLEFGITAVSGLSGQDPDGRWGPAVLFGHDGFEIRLQKGMETTRYQPARHLEDTMDLHERIRLLYVALTRARDHLVVSAHHKATNGRDRSHGARLATTLAAADAAASGPTAFGPADVERWTSSAEPDEPATPHVPAGDGAASPTAPDPEATASWSRAQEEWEDDRGRAWTRGPTVISATALSLRAHGDGRGDSGRGDSGRGDTVSAADEREPEQEPWRRGRGGTQVGSAVHAVLQHARLDPVDPDEIAALARWQAGVEGVSDAAPEIERKAMALATSELVTRAMGATRWRREVHVSAPVAAIIGVDHGSRPGVADHVEGFVDLLFDDGDGLVVVDYKTDGIVGDAALAAAVTRHTPQGAAYALAVEAATGRPVREVHFLFVRGDDAVDGRVEDLAGATHALRELLRRGDGTGDR